MITQYLLFALVIGMFGVYVWHQKRALMDAEALFWATVSEPFFVISRHPKDETAATEAAHIREMLRKHGNARLDYTGTPENPDGDVWVYIYGSEQKNTSRDFQLFCDLTLLEVVKRREEWRKQKAEYNPQAARQHFGGQTVYTQINAN